MSYEMSVVAINLCKCDLPSVMFWYFSLVLLNTICIARSLVKQQHFFYFIRRAYLIVVFVIGRAFCSYLFIFFDGNTRKIAINNNHQINS